MTNFKYLILFILSFGMVCFGDLPKLNDKEWIVFVKAEGKELFSLFFPVDPITEIKRDDGRDVFSAEAELDGVDYSFYVIPNEDGRLSEKDFLEKKSKLELVSSIFFERGGERVLDIVYKNPDLTEVCKSRIVFTKQNVYLFFTVFQPFQKEFHKYFISSFAFETIS